MIRSLCAFFCAASVPLAAVAQQPAESAASAEPVPDAADAARTVLEIAASGRLSDVAAGLLGETADLTVRLHGPVAFDVDTADFASLEIYADDPAVRLTVSETAAYDRITAISLPKASGSAATTFTAAAATVADSGASSAGDDAVTAAVLSSFNLGLTAADDTISGVSSEEVTLGTVVFSKEGAGSTSMGDNNFYPFDTIVAGGIAVNCQFSSADSSWTMKLPLTLPSGKTWADTYYVTPEIFVCSGTRGEQSDPKKLCFELTILDGEGVAYETAKAPGVVFAGKKLNTQSVKLVRTGSATLSETLTLRVKVAANDIGGGTFTGIRGIKFDAVTPQVISINFGQTANGISTGNAVAEDATSVGLAPVPGNAWVTSGQTDVNTERQDAVRSVYDGEAVVPLTSPVEVRYRANNYWAWDDTAAEARKVADSFLVSYLDDGGTGAQVTVSGIPFATYGVYIYMATDSGGDNFTAPYVNGVRYTGGSGQGPAVVGATAFGSARKKVAQLNVNALYVDNLSSSSLTVKGVASGRSRGGIAALQIVNTGGTAAGIAVPDSGSLDLDATYAGNVVTATLGADSTLNIKDGGFARLTVVSDAHATLRVGAEVELSKIDLTQAPNVQVVIASATTLTVSSATVSPYWEVGGTLSFKEGGQIAVAVAAGVTPPNPYCVIRAADVSGTASVSASDIAAGKIKIAQVDSDFWLLSAGGIRCEVPAATDEDGVLDWSKLPWADSVSGALITDPVFATTSDVTLVFNTTSAKKILFDGAKATAEGAVGNVYINSLTIRTPDGVNPVIMYGSNRFWANGAITIVGEGATSGQPETYPTVTMPVRAHAAIDNGQVRGVLTVTNATLVLAADNGTDADESGQFNGTWYRKNPIRGNGIVRYEGEGTLQLDATVSPSRFEPGVTLEVTRGVIDFPNNGSTTCNLYVDSNLTLGSGSKLTIDEWSQRMHFGESATVTMKGGAELILKNGNGSGGPIQGGAIFIDATSEAPVVFSGSANGGATDIQTPISGRGTLRLTGINNSWTISGMITDAGADEADRLSVVIATDKVSLTNVNNAFSGGVTVPAGTTTAANDPNAFGAGPVSVEGTLKLSESFAQGNVISGNGTLECDGKLPVGSSGNDSLTQSAWTGRVLIKNVTFRDTANTLAKCGNSGSTIDFGVGNSGYFQKNGTCSANIVISGAMEVNNGYSDSSYTFSGNLSGAGSLTVSGSPTDTVRFSGDASQFGGTISVSGGRCVAFGEPLLTHENGKILVASSSPVKIASGKTWTATVVKEGGTLEVANNSTVSDPGITIENGGTLKPTGTSASCTSDLTFEDGAVLDRGEVAINISSKTLVMPEVGKVIVLAPQSVADWTTTYAVRRLIGTVGDAERTMAAKFVVRRPDERGAYVTDASRFIVAKTDGFGFGELSSGSEGVALPAPGSKLAEVVQQAAAASGATAVTLVYGQSGGTDLTADVAEKAAELFTGIATTATEGTATTVTVSYDFGITGISVNTEGAIEVKAKIQNTAGGTAAFGPGTHVNLYLVDAAGVETAVATEAGTSATNGEVTLTVTNGLDKITTADGTLKFVVKAEKTAAGEGL